MSRYQKAKTNLDFTEARDSGISWAICKSAPCSRQITTPATHHSVFYRPDALLAAQPTVSKHWRDNLTYLTIHTHTHLTALCPGLPGWAGTRKVIWILLEQETVSGSGISWTICKSAPSSRQITMPAPHHSVFTGRMPFLPPNQQCQSTEGFYLLQGNNLMHSTLSTYSIIIFSPYIRNNSYIFTKKWTLIIDQECT